MNRAIAKNIKLGTKLYYNDNKINSKSLTYIFLDELSELDFGLVCLSCEISL